MACGSTLAWYDLVPILSYCALSGRCRSCGSGLSIQYPLVELSVGALFLFAYLIVPPLFSFWPIIAFVSLLVFLASLVGLVAYDMRHTLVPMPFVSVLLLSAAAAPIAQSFALQSLQPFLDSLLGGAALSGFFIVIVLLTRRRGMGEGDAYVAGAVGLLLGLFRGMEALMIGMWIGTLVALALLLLSSLSAERRLLGLPQRVTMKTELPLVPFLALGVLVAIFSDFSPIALAGSLMSALAPHL